MLLRGFFFLLIIGAVASCSKVARVDRQSLKGSYDWSYSYSSFIGAYSSTEDANQYGVKIKTSGKVYFFMNGEIVRKGKITDFVSDNSSSAQFVVEWDGDYSNDIFEMVVDQISCQGWPHSHYTNHFQKFEEE
jgi:hypothetical protein